ncbi:MAG: hypothetical protein ACREYC_18280 [Gammaproteobacteria bacterium]
MSAPSTELRTGFAQYVELAARLPVVPRPSERAGAGKRKRKKTPPSKEVRAQHAEYMRARRAAKRDLVP